MATDRPMNGDIFRTFVERFLVPTLRSGDIVIMDNLASHKVAGVPEAIEAAGAQLLYLPPYSPDLNPIEQAFAKLKALLRKAAEGNVEALWARIGVLLDSFRANECANYFRNAGYNAPHQVENALAPFIHRTTEFLAGRAGSTGLTAAC